MWCARGVRRMHTRDTRRKQVRTPALQRMLLVEMVARVVKITLRERVRDTMRQLRVPLEQVL
jgi:hypothetical protein